MNTERVKNILIAALSVVALTLGFMIFVQEGRYTLSGAQEAAIISLLERNDIHISTAQMVTDSRPMRQLALERYDYDIDGLAARFFGAEISNVRIEELGLGLVAFETDYKAMAYSFQDNWIIFEIPGGISNDAFVAASGAAAARVLAEWYIEELLDMPPGMEFFRQIINYRGEYVISFFSSYRGHLLYNDHIRVTVTDRGIIHILYSRVQDNGFIGETQSIFSADEALLALLNHLRHNLQIEGRIGISNMYMAYFLVQEGGRSVGVPAYVFTIFLGENLTFNYVFNALTNTYIWHEILR